jgi:hypothetical protein
LVPTLDPLTFHWYEGAVPPLAIVALNVTLVPLQTGLLDAETTMAGVTLVVNETTMLLLVAVAVV